MGGFQNSLQLSGCAVFEPKMADDAGQLNCKLNPKPTFPMIQPTSCVSERLYKCIMTCISVHVTMLTFS